MSATNKEKIIAIEAPIGIGLIYGPIMPDTNAIGSTDAMTVSVARIVGFPTSLIAKRAAFIGGSFSALKCRYIFSAIIIESSVTIPVTKTNANKVIRLRVYPRK